VKLTSSNIIGQRFYIASESYDTQLDEVCADGHEALGEDNNNYDQLVLQFYCALFTGTDVMSTSVWVIEGLLVLPGRGGLTTAMVDSFLREWAIESAILFLATTGLNSFASKRADQATGFLRNRAW
jgi:hypothetical protein